EDGIRDDLVTGVQTCALPIFLGRWAADRAKAPFIVHTIHGLAFTASTSRMVNSVYRMLERQAAPLTDRIVCVADAMRDQSLAARSEERRVGEEGESAASRG